MDVVNIVNNKYNVGYAAPASRTMASVEDDVGLEEGREIAEEARRFRWRDVLKSDFVRFFGPAWLVMIADMDGSSLIESAQTGALYGYGLIWLFLILILPLYVVQELAGRIGVATGQGLGSVIRENYSKGWSLAMTVPMAVTDIITYAIEYIAIAIGLEIVGVSLWYSLPAIYVIHILVVTKRKYRQAEIPLLLISGILIGALTATLLLTGVQPWSSPTANPVLFESNPTFLVIVAASVGAVIMPFMLFFQASATGIKSTELRETGVVISKKRAQRIMRIETLLGAIVTEVLMVIVVMAFASVTGAQNLDVFASAAQLGRVLAPIAGPYSPYMFCLGLVAAAFVALIVMSMASAWGIGESLNMDKRSIWILYVVESLPGIAAALLIPSGYLINVVIYLLVFFVFVLIGPIVMMGLIGGNKRIMGGLAMKPWERVVYWVTLVSVISTAFIAVVYSL